MAVKKGKSKADVYEIVTQRIMEKMEQGIIPWHQPWGGLGAPKNLTSGKAYRGINTFLLGSAGKMSSYWLTFKQIQDKGGHLKKGAKSEIVVFFKKLENKDANRQDGETGDSDFRPRMVLRYYRVFSMDDVEGIENPEEIKELDFVPIEKAEQIVDGYRGKPLIKDDSKAAYYTLKDVVGMPPKTAFHSVGEYYSTLFHELVHSTGHTRRLNRQGFSEGATAMFGTKTYSKEELIAEIGNAFLCAESAIEGVFDNSVAYIQGWLRKFKDHPKMIVQAAAAAQKATDHILGRQPETF